MAFTTSNELAVPYRRSGNQKKTVTLLTFSGTSTSEGEAVKNSELGLFSIEYADTALVSSNSTEATPIGSASYDKASGKVKWTNGKTGAELAGSISLTGVKVRVVAYGW